MERHHVHVVGRGAFHELAACIQCAVGGQIEPVLPRRLFQVQRVDGGIAQIE